MRTLLFAAAWGAASVGYWWGVLTMTGVMFGREGSAYHLGWLAMALIVWVAGSIVAARAGRSRSGAGRGDG